MLTLVTAALVSVEGTSFGTEDAEGATFSQHKVFGISIIIFVVFMIVTGERMFASPRHNLHFPQCSSSLTRSPRLQCRRAPQEKNHVLEDQLRRSRKCRDYCSPLWWPAPNGSCLVQLLHRPRPNRTVRIGFSGGNLP